MGFNTPFAGLIPLTGWTIPPDKSGGLAVISTRQSTAASAFLPVRAHVSFVPRRPPRLIFVGVTDRLLEGTRSAKAIGRGC
jgi:hypothetical protein